MATKKSTKKIAEARVGEPKQAAKPKKSTMRESSAKSRAKADKPKRVRKAASIAKKPINSVSIALKKEYHLVKPKDKPTFFTKSRTLTPNYFKSALKELRQVTFPGRKETWRLVLAVFMFALVMGITIAVLDYGLEKLLREVIL